ncbi:MAG: ABC transporter ATP-binding protein [Clostridiales Family XIII bacterium]|jgi:ABC-2 type transport system ATP-binding protein|nr:ABC transporter ATP-binding protein [Clostridiales Family XIII bacterium]
MIEIKHLQKKYGGHVAVDDLNLTIEPGRIYGFLGPNGAGKSTTMNIITGYLGATQGTVEVDGFDIFEKPEEAKRRIGYLPETPPLYMDMTVEEYLDFAAELKGVDRDVLEAHVDEVMERTRTWDVRERLIRNLSKGYRQRVGLAQAILGYPAIIILDEPTIGLDPAQIIEMRTLIRELGQSHTVILSSHILSEVRETCDYIFIIAGGRLVASDTTENLIAGAGSGRQELKLLVRGDGQDAAAALASIREVDTASVATAPGAEPETTSVTFRTKDDVDARQPILAKLVRRKCEVLEFASTGKSLEDIFMDLVASGEAPEDVPEQAEEDVPEQTEEVDA